MLLWNLKWKKGETEIWYGKKWGKQGAAGCVTDVLTTFGCLVWSITLQAHGKREFIYFMIKYVLYD